MASMKPEEGTIMPSTAKYKADSSPIIQGFGCRALENNLGWNHLGGFCVQLPATFTSKEVSKLLYLRRLATVFLTMEWIFSIKILNKRHAPLKSHEK